MYEDLIKSLRTDHDKYFARDMEAADAIEDMNRQLATDVRPARLGKLEKYGAAIRCSECGFDTQSWAVNFCPNCGAQMIGGDDDV